MKYIAKVKIRGLHPMPMAKYKRIKYQGREQGIPLTMDEESAMEASSAFGYDVKYSVVSPYSPYILGWDLHAKMVQDAQARGIKDLGKAFKSRVDFKKRTVYIWRRE